MKTIEVVAAVIVSDGKILATQRADADQAGKWEFPGGKIEAGETLSDALRREIREELNMDIKVGECITTVFYDYADFSLVMHCFFASPVSAGMALNEHLSAKWLSPEELDSVDWLDADRRLLQLLRLSLSRQAREI
ncbi:MAG: (deoxy)nucleoside triphosphate pyrophosphohydrolase [Muribaculaceae bacterium]|nr:(deoxy)nucleoside triphosphate pyrophosphohydrolase [Muribaculaceae bacterium]